MKQLDLFNQIETGYYIYNHIQDGKWEQGDPFKISTLPTKQKKALFKNGCCPLAKRVNSEIGTYYKLIGVISLISLLS